MKQVYVFKAGNVGDKSVEATRILISGAFPDDTGSLQETNEMLNEDAEKLFRALRESLPQGVFDRLAAKMLTSVASSLTINRL